MKKRDIKIVIQKYDFEGNPNKFLIKRFIEGISKSGEEYEIATITELDNLIIFLKEYFKSYE